MNLCKNSIFYLFMAKKLLRLLQKWIFGGIYKKTLVRRKSLSYRPLSVYGWNFPITMSVIGLNPLNPELSEPLTDWWGVDGDSPGLLKSSSWSDPERERSSSSPCCSRSFLFSSSPMATASKWGTAAAEREDSP